MTKPILILQFRPEPEIRQHEQKCFNKLLTKANLSPESLALQFHDAIQHPIPNFSQIKQKYSSLIFGGSSLMLSALKQPDSSPCQGRGDLHNDPLASQEGVRGGNLCNHPPPSQGGVRGGDLQNKNVLNKTNKLINNLIKADFPTLGICFGAQLIAYHLNIPVIRASHLVERGSYHTQLTAKGKNNLLFEPCEGSKPSQGFISKKFYTQMGHLDSIPYNNKTIQQFAKQKINILSTNPQQTQIHSFQIKNNIYATIFHPELDYQTQLERAQFYLTETELQKFKTTQLPPSPHSTQTLVNFLTKITL